MCSYWRNHSRNDAGKSTIKQSLQLSRFIYGSINQTVNLLANAFDGSNPSPTTILKTLILLMFSTIISFYPPNWFRLISPSKPIIPATYLLQPPFAVNSDFSE